MNPSPIDPVIDEIRQARRRISEQCNNDPAQLVAHYMKLQEQYRDRLIQTGQARKDQDQSAA